MYDDHLRQQHGEALPHVFVADVTRYVVARFEAARELSNTDPAHQVLGEFEAGLRSGDGEVESLIAISFLEKLDCGSETGRRVRGALGPSSSTELARMEDWWRERAERTRRRT